MGGIVAFVAVVAVVAVVTGGMLPCREGHAAETARGIVAPPGVTRVATLEQNWSEDEAAWFYDTGQGSRLVPYDWFLHLARPGAAEPFRSVGHMRSLGFIARVPTPGNPDGLPVGLVRDAAYADGTPGLGVTCAACHTRLVTRGGTAWVVDGGPSGADVEAFLRALTAALEETAADDARFAAFARAVIPEGSADESATLRDVVRAVVRQRAGYDARNLSPAGGTPHGFGRVDAFGAIFNEVASTFLAIPANARPADAPVSFPCLWDTPQHDRVQWNGIAFNFETPLGKPLFGTTRAGALGRNTGEVLGVFGYAHVDERELLLPRIYESTADKANLLAFEESIERLWSPRWPAAFGPLDPERVRRGGAIHAARCAECHAAIVRDDPGRRVTAVMRAVGTDGTLLANFTRVRIGRPMALRQASADRRGP